MKSFISDFEKDKLSAIIILSKIPHIISHKHVNKNSNFFFITNYDYIK